MISQTHVTIVNSPRGRGSHASSNQFDKVQTLYSNLYILLRHSKHSDREVSNLIQHTIWGPSNTSTTSIQESLIQDLLNWESLEGDWRVRRETRVSMPKRVIGLTMWTSQLWQNGLDLLPLVSKPHLQSICFNCGNFWTNNCYLHSRISNWQWRISLTLSGCIFRTSHTIVIIKWVWL